MNALRPLINTATSRTTQNQVAGNSPVLVLAALRGLAPQLIPWEEAKDVYAMTLWVLIVAPSLSRFIAIAREYLRYKVYGDRRKPENAHGRRGDDAPPA